MLDSPHIDDRSTPNIHFVVEIQNSWFWNIKLCTCVSYWIHIVSARSVLNTYRIGCWPYRPSPNWYVWHQQQLPYLLHNCWQDNSLKNMCWNLHKSMIMPKPFRNAKLFTHVQVRTMKKKQPPFFLHTCTCIHVQGFREKGD